MNLLRDFYKFRKQHSGGRGAKEKSEGGLKKWRESKNRGIGGRRGKREGQV